MVYIKSAAYLMALAIFTFTNSALAVGLSNVPSAHHNPHHKLGPENPKLVDAFFAGKFDLWVRTRYEDVKDDIPANSPLANADRANLFSTRIQAGYTTARWHGFYLRAEGETAFRMNGDSAFNVGNDLDFPPGPGGSRIQQGHAIIPDNNFAEVNEALIGWRSSTGGCPSAPGPCNGTTSIKLGRQSILYDNHRWVGDIVWRNNHQSYNALRIDNSSLKNVNISYSNIRKVKRLFGESSPFNEWKLRSGHLINVSYKFPIGKLVGYGYLLDFNDNPRSPFPEGVGVGPGITNFDSDTWGLRFFGKYPLGNAFDLLYDVELANQDASGDSGPTLDDNDYRNFEVGIEFGGTRVDGLGLMPIGETRFTIKLGHEVLEGNGVNALQTPLATVHAFNGWADKFVGAPGGSATPTGGLEDTSLSIIVAGLGAQYIGKSKIIFQYHDFSADTTVNGIKDYGTEWGIAFAKPFNNRLLGLVKYADYNADSDVPAANPLSFDTEKFWLLMQYRFK